MAVSPSFKDFIAEQLDVVGPVSIRPMFGGAGVYSGDVMFALIAYETLYLKADAATSADFEAEGKERFTYDGKDKPVQMSYWECPERLYDDPDEMKLWAEKSLAIAKHTKRPAKTRKKKRP